MIYWRGYFTVDNKSRYLAFDCSGDNKLEISNLDKLCCVKKSPCMTSKQDHQRWIYITIDHLTIEFHMKRFEQNNQLAQSDWEVGRFQS